MDWQTFSTEFRHESSQTFNIEVDDMSINKWDELLEFLKQGDYFISYATVEKDVLSNITGSDIVSYFDTDTEHWPCLVLSINGFRLDGFIKSKNKLELWFNDRDEIVLTKQNFDALVVFMTALSKKLNSTIQFINEDAVSERQIFTIDSN